MTVDELKEYGLVEMKEEDIRDFLASQTVGVLGLAGDDAPYILPIAYIYNRNSDIYFNYFVGQGSQKDELSRNGAKVSFLVYSATTMFTWESVMVEGNLSSVPRDEWEDLEDVLEGAWHLDIFDRAETEGKMRIYRLDIEELSGIRYTGLPPDFEE